MQGGGRQAQFQQNKVKIIRNSRPSVGVNKSHLYKNINEQTMNLKLKKNLTHKRKMVVKFQFGQKVREQF